MAEERGGPSGRRAGPNAGSNAGSSSAGASDAGTSGGKYLALGFQFVASILLFLFLGRWLDSRLGTAPWLLIAGVFVGAGASFYSIYRQLMSDLRREEASRASRGGGPTAGSAT